MNSKQMDPGLQALARPIDVHYCMIEIAFCAKQNP